jgi:hypothetical protein
MKFLFIYSFSLIGIQEIGNKESLDLIRDELNNPTIPSIKDWPNRHQGKWNYTISDIAGKMFQVNFEDLFSLFIFFFVFEYKRDLNILDFYMMNQLVLN